MPATGNVATGVYGETAGTFPSSGVTNLLAAHINQNAQGTWTLSIQDWAGGDSGNLVGATLWINGNPVPEPATMTALALGIGAIAARRRRK